MNEAFIYQCMTVQQLCPELYQEKIQVYSSQRAVGHTNYMLTSEKGGMQVHADFFGSANKAGYFAGLHNLFQALMRGDFDGTHDSQGQERQDAQLLLPNL